MERVIPNIRRENNHWKIKIIWVKIIHNLINIPTMKTNKSLTKTWDLFHKYILIYPNKIIYNKLLTINNQLLTISKINPIKNLISPHSFPFFNLKFKSYYFSPLKDRSYIISL